MMYKLIDTLPLPTTNVSSGNPQSPLRHAFAPAASGRMFPHVNVPGDAPGAATSTSELPVMRVCTTGSDDQLAAKSGGKLTFRPYPRGSSGLDDEPALSMTPCTILADSAATTCAGCDVLLTSL